MLLTAIQASPPIMTRTFSAQVATYRLPPLIGNLLDMTEKQSLAEEANGVS